MKNTRSEEVNRALEARRKLMVKRIRLGRVLLAIWVVAAVLNLVLLFGNRQYRLPLSSVSADLLLMLRFLYPQQGVTILLIPAAFLIPAGLILANVFWKKHSSIRLAVFLLLWLDVICLIAAWLWNPAMLFGESELCHIVAVLNFACHIFLVWHISRARRAVESLEVLPEHEYEGDPFEEFRNRSDD